MPCGGIDRIDIGDDAADGMPIGHRLTECHDIGNDARGLVAPHVRACAAETGLHLIGDHEAAGLAHGSNRLIQEARRQIRKAFVGKERIDDDGREAVRCVLKRGDCLLDFGCEGRRKSVSALAAERTVAVGSRHMADMAAETANRRHAGR